MTEAVHQILAKLDTLSQPERAELAYALIQSLDDNADADAEALWDSELSRRVAEIRSGQVTGKPAEQLFDELSQ